MTSAVGGADGSDAGGNAGTGESGTDDSGSGNDDGASLDTADHPHNPLALCMSFGNTAASCEGYNLYGLTAAEYAEECLDGIEYWAEAGSAGCYDAVLDQTACIASLDCAELSALVACPVETATVVTLCL